VAEVSSHYNDYNLVMASRPFCLCRTTRPRFFKQCVR